MHYLMRLFLGSLWLFQHLSLHCSIEDQADDGEEDEDVVGVGGHVGKVDLEESLGHGLSQDVSRHAAVHTWKNSEMQCQNRNS